MLQSREQRRPLHPRDSSDLVELIPYLLGYHPDDSVVMVDVRPRQLVVGRALRFDLDPVLAAPDSVGELTTHFAGSAYVVVVIYGAAVRRTAQLFPRIALSLQGLGVEVLDALLVDGDRWWSMMFGDHCCRPDTAMPVLPPGGRPSSIAAEATVAGLTALPDREALERSLDPVTAAGDEEVAAAVVAAEAELAAAAATAGGLVGWRRATVEGFRTVLRQAREHIEGYPPHWLATGELARLLVGLLDLPVRDGCWRALELDHSSTAFNLCWQLVRRAHEPYRAPALFLLGWVAWRRGDGAVARAAADRCRDADADYEAARLLLVVLDRGVPPARVPRLLMPRRARRIRRRSP